MGTPKGDMQRFYDTLQSTTPKASLYANRVLKEGSFPETPEARAVRVNQLQQPAPVKAQNKGTKNALIEQQAITDAKKRTGGVIYDPDTGVGLEDRDEARSVGRKQALVDARIKNPNKLVTAGQKSGQAINRLARPIGRLPGALGLLDAAQTARALKAFREKPWPIAAGVDGQDL